MDQPIKASEKLPDVGAPVLFWSSVDEWSIGKLIEGGTHWEPDGYGFRVKLADDLHWLPLPPAPPGE